MKTNSQARQDWKKQHRQNRVPITWLERVIYVREQVQEKLSALMAQVHAEIEPELDAKRRAEANTYIDRHGIENSPEFYGMKFAPDEFRFHNPGQDSQVESDWIGETVARAASHNHETKSMFKPLV